MTFRDTARDLIQRWLHRREKDPFAGLSFTTAEVTRKAGKNHITTFTASYKGAEIGSVKVQVTTRGYGYVHDLKVIPEARRRAVGSRLMHEVITYFGTVCRLELVPHSPGGEVSDGVLQKFYASSGFVSGRTAADRENNRVSDANRMFRPPGTAF